MFGSELIPIVLFVILLFLVPESPRWLAQQDRQGEALEVLTRVDGREPAEREIKAIEASLTTSEGRFSELFAPGIRVAVFVAFMVALMSRWTGWSVISFYMPTIFQKAGVTETTDAIFQSIIPNIGNLLFTIIGMILVDTVGRRPLYLVCSIAMVFFNRIARSFPHPGSNGMAYCFCRHYVFLAPRYRFWCFGLADNVGDFSHLA